MHTVAKSIIYIKFGNLCFDWNIEKVAALTDDNLIEITKIPGIIPNMRKLLAMRSNAKKILNLKQSCGSFLIFLKSFNNVDELAEALSSEKSKFKFEYIAQVTVHDFLRNTGFDSIKPDRHVTRFLQRIGLLAESVTEQLTILVAKQLAHNANITQTMLDRMIYFFCGDRPDVIKIAICGMIPLCGECPITKYCKLYEANYTNKAFNANALP